jgi:Sugar (and other) transporter
MTAAMQRLFNFVITEITPSGVNHIGWRTFIMFACFCVGNDILVFSSIEETARKSLESMDVLFGTVDAARRAQDVERMLEDKGTVVHAENATQTKDQTIAVEVKQCEGPLVSDILGKVWQCNYHDIQNSLCGRDSSSSLQEVI